MSRVHWLRCALFNLLGAIVWAVLVAGIGYALGEALTRLLGEAQRAEEWVFGIVLACGLMRCWGSSTVSSPRISPGGPASARLVRESAGTPAGPARAVHGFIERRRLTLRHG